MSTRRRTLGIYASNPPLDEHGKRLCRNCRGAMPKGARHNCSPKCSDEWMCKTSPSHLRWKLRERDKGICAICSLDTIALKKEFAEFCGEIQRSWVTIRSLQSSQRSLNERVEWLKSHGIPAGRSCSDWWDADHIIPVVEGGGETGLDNFRTLCIPCHKKETALLRKRMAEQRKLSKPLPLLGGCS